MKYSVFPPTVLAGGVLLAVGCGKLPNQLDDRWSPPVKVAVSIDNLAGGIRLHKFQNTIMGLQSLQGGFAKWFFLNRTNNSWFETARVSAPTGYLWGWWALEPQSKRLLLPEGHVENGQLVMRALLGTIEENARLSDATEKKWLADKKSCFGETDENVQLKELYLGVGSINGSELYIAYCLNGERRTERGPFNTGVFHSSDAGQTWQMERISDFEGEEPSVCKSKNYYYYFTQRGLSHAYGLWFSRKPVEGGSWESSGELTKTFATVYGRYAAVPEADTVHVCWMDCRNDMKRFNVDGPNIENDDIVYCHRKDSDSGWSKEVNLSKGLLYTYSPILSVEGNNIVVAWSGIRSAGKHHNEYDANDIYYVTSKDGGMTWTKPLMVTDKAKDGINSGKPQVMLLNGVIHLFYIQGALEKAKQISPGLTKLNQRPWPIYYQQRPFPN